MSPRVLLSKTFNLRKNVFNSLGRFYSSDTATLSNSLRAEELKSKGLLRVSGPDVNTFLQGLITNDINHLGSGKNSIYAAFLNIKGRIIYETIIYKTKEENSFFIECDSRGIPELEKHLKVFKVRKKIDITNISDDLKIWVIFDGENLSEASTSVKDVSNLEKSLPKNLNLQTSDVYKDPRLSDLGVRILVPSSSNFVASLKNCNIASSLDISFRQFRYRLGIGEGADELPPGKCFPHETNCDYLHGISFHKGCYIGQEVTSRTQHTGVVRKRLMPLEFMEDVGDRCPFDSPITDPDKNSVIGKIRGVESPYGIALLRISETLEAKRLEINGIPVRSSRPNWWPKEVPKEKLNLE